MKPVVRFAPSPTGRLHIGNIRTAILNYLLARKAGGTFILRLDDTDRERSTEAFAEGIRTDLRWLGFEWQREERQSLRLARYAEIAERRFATWRMGNVRLNRVNLGTVLRFSETAVLDPFAMSGKAAIALLEELMSTAATVSRDGA